MGGRPSVHSVTTKSTEAGEYLKWGNVYSTLTTETESYAPGAVKVSVKSSVGLSRLLCACEQPSLCSAIYRHLCQGHGICV